MEFLLFLLSVGAPLVGASIVQDQNVTAIIGVNVVPMDRERVLSDQTVLVEGGRISAVGPRASVRIPAGATRIEGRGLWLMPGLADMHVHPELTADLPLYLGFGVTTVAHMGGSARRWAAVRDSVRAGRLDGPDILVSVFLNGASGGGGPPGAPGVEAARALVARGDSVGADFVKVYNGLSAGQYSAVMEEARARRMPVMGHAVRAIGLERGFAAGQVAVTHVEEYIYADFQNRIAVTSETRDSRLEIRDPRIENR